jgi:hypothetical protein
VPQQFPVEAFTNTPGWLATLFLGIWVTLWFLEKTNRLPGTKPNYEEATQRIRDERFLTLLVELTKKVDDLSHAVTELRVELAKKD